jgi:hypothetical protein
VDVVRGANAPRRPNLVIDVTATARLGRGWALYARPWFRQPREPRWDKEIYQAAIQYERPGAVATRIDMGYIVSPIGLGIMDMHPAVNPTITPHLAYLIPMPPFDPGAPVSRPVAGTYPLGAQMTVSTDRWDARAALVSSAPARIYVINGDRNPQSAPVVEAGAGLTPTAGLRVGMSFAHGTYVTDAETTRNPGARSMTLLAVEGEYAVGYTKLSGELVHDRLESAVGTDTAYAWFVQGARTLAPRWYVAARHEGVSAPPLRTATFVGSRMNFRLSEATIGVRVSREFTVRGSAIHRRGYGATRSDRQVATSLVWARQW